MTKLRTRKAKQAFHDRRKRGIGGSDVAKILGLSKWGTAYDVWREKLRAGDVVEKSTPRTEFGIIMESEVAKFYAKKNGFIYKKEKNQLYHPVYPFLVGHIDGWLEARKKGPTGARGIIEVKTTSKRVFDSWNGEIPREYYCQVQHYLFVAGVKWARLVVMVTETRELHDYLIEADKDYHESILPNLLDFWNNNVLKNAPPEMTAADYGGLETTSPEAVEADVATANAYRTLRDIAVEQSEVERQVETLKNTLKEFMGDHEVLTCNGQVIATWKSQKGRITFDAKKFKADDPATYALYLTEGPPTRQFRPKVAEESQEND